jgi:hypothetical protein
LRITKSTQNADSLSLGAKDVGIIGRTTAGRTTE